MTAVRVRFASELRSRWKGWLALVVLVGAFAGAVGFARQLGIVPRPALPVVTFLVLGLAALLVANLIAVLPGRAAARVRPAPVLRSE